MSTLSSQITATARAFECILGNNLYYGQLVSARTTYMRKLEAHARKATNPRTRELLAEAIDNVVDRCTVDLALEAGRVEAGRVKA